MSLTWEHPSALWLLSLLLLLLLVRPKLPVRRISVSGLHLWTGLRPAHTASLSHKWRHHRHLLMQAAFIVVAALAIANPRLTFGDRDVSIILDASMSMGARDGTSTRLDTAKQRIVALARDLPFGTRVRVYVASADVKALGELSAGELESAMTAVVNGDSGADIRGAIAAARADAPGARIYVLSDASAQPPSVNALTWIGVGGPADNVAISTFEATPDDDADEVSILVNASNFGARPMRGDLIITHDDRVLTSANVEIEPGRVAATTFRVPMVSGGLTARLDADDALPADNVRYAIIGSQKRLNVLMIGRTQFVEHAIAVHPRVASFDSETVTPAEEPHVVICAACNGVPLQHQRSPVLFVPASAPRIERASAPLVIVDRDHAIMRGVAASGTPVVVTDTEQPADTAAVIARAGGAPVILSYDVAGRRVVEFRFDVDRFAAEADALLPLLISNTLDWLAPASDQQIEAGESFRLTGVSSPDASVSGPGDVQIHRTATGGTIVDGIHQAGIYRMRAGEQTFMLGVNPAVSEESDLSAPPSPATATSDRAVGLSEPTNLGVLLLITALAVLAWETTHRRAVEG